MTRNDLNSLPGADLINRSNRQMYGIYCELSIFQAGLIFNIVLLSCRDHLCCFNALYVLLRNKPPHI